MAVQQTLANVGASEPFHARINASIARVKAKIDDLEKVSADPQIPIDPNEFGSAFHVLGVLSLQVNSNKTI